MNLRARWVGPPPRIWDYLMSEVRPRFAYRVDQVTCASSRVHWDSTAKAEARQLQITVSRVAKDGVPPHARVHPWKWDRREARSRGATR